MTLHKPGYPRNTLPLINMSSSGMEVRRFRKDFEESEEIVDLVSGTVDSSGLLRELLDENDFEILRRRTSRPLCGRDPLLSGPDDLLSTQLPAPPIPT